MLNKENKERLAAFVAAFVIVCGAVLAGYSQRPPPSRGEQQEQVNPDTANAGQATDSHQSDAQASPFKVQIIPTPEQKAEAAREQHDEETGSTGEWWLVTWTGWLFGATVALVVVATVQVMFFVVQLRLMKGGMAHTRDAAKAARDTARATVLAERAYIKMTYTPPGLNFFDDGMITVEIKTVNFGRTPGTLQGMYCRFQIAGNGAQLPDLPDYGLGNGRFQRSHMILAGGGEDAVFQRFDFAVNPAVSALIRAGTTDAFVYGYIDYRDAFGGIHRAGYGRHYEPGSDVRAAHPTPQAWDSRHNLGIIGQPDYNYDRPRRREEAGHPEG